MVDSDDDEEAEAPAARPSAPAAAAADVAQPAGKRQVKCKTVLDEDSDSAEDWEAPKQAAGGRACLTQGTLTFTGRGCPLQWSIIRICLKISQHSYVHEDIWAPPEVYEVFSAVVQVVQAPARQLQLQTQQ